MILRWASLLLAMLLLPATAWSAGDHAVVAAGGAQWAFHILALFAIVCSLCTVFFRNPVIAALFLVLTLSFTAGIYLLLQATFLAVIQVLVYAGAIMVLFIFVVMSIAHPEEEELGLLRGTWYKLLGLGALGVLGWRLAAAVARARLPVADVDPAFGDVTSVGRLLFADYLFPFEALSLLLLVAIVGAVMVTRRVKRPSGDRAIPREGDGC